MCPRINLMKKLIQIFRNIIQYLETADIPFSYFILTFLAATTLRNFFEQLVFPDTDPAHMAVDFLHYYLSYICLAFVFIILFRIATKEDVARISRVVLPAFIILNIVPLLDYFFLGQGREYSLGYIFPDQHGPLLTRFLTFFGPLGESGITIGMRIEIVIVILTSGFYFALKGLSWPKNLFFCVVTYSLIFIYCALPYSIKGFFKLMNIDCALDARLLIQFYLLLIFLLRVGLAFLYRRDYFLALVKDMRLFRLLHFELMFFIGMAWATHMGTGIVVWNQQRFFEIVFTTIAIAQAWMFSVITNNLADIQSDRINAKQRPTISETIPLDQIGRAHV